MQIAQDACAAPESKRFDEVKKIMQTGSFVVSEGKDSWTCIWAEEENEYVKYNGETCKAR